jgi:hypothetical protein
MHVCRTGDGPGIQYKGEIYVVGVVVERESVVVERETLLCEKCVDAMF